MLCSVFTSSKFYVFCQVKETHMCYSYETSWQCHNNNDEIEFFCFRGGLGSFCKTGVLLNGFRKPPGVVPQVVTASDCIRGICHFPFSDPDVGFEGTWPRSCHPSIVLTAPFSLWFKMSLATPPSYSLIYLFLEGKANIINLYLQRWLRDQCCLDHLAITKILNMWLF